MPHPKSNGVFACCAKCHKEFLTRAAILSHLRSKRCDVHPGTFSCFGIASGFQAGSPKLYKGKPVVEDYENNQKIASFPAPHQKEAYIQFFINWATEEFVEGRQWAPIRLSSCNQVLGTVRRLTLAQGKYLKSWDEVLTVGAVKKYVDELDSRGHTATYLSSEVSFFHF